MISASRKGIKDSRHSNIWLLALTMNTDKFDKNAKNNLAFYEGFLNISKYVVSLIIITLALMAYFLVWK